MIRYRFDLAIALVKMPLVELVTTFLTQPWSYSFLLLAFTSQLVKFTVPFDIVTGATPLMSTRAFS